MSTRPGYVGQRLKRTQDALLRGQARYLDDIRVPGTLHVAFVRSPHAHARVLRVHTAAASSAPGVRAVVSGADLDGVPAMRSDRMDAGTCRTTECPVPARHRVRHVGEAAAAAMADAPAPLQPAVNRLPLVPSRVRELAAAGAAAR